MDVKKEKSILQHFWTAVIIGLLALVGFVYLAGTAVPHTALSMIGSAGTVVTFIALVVYASHELSLLEKLGRSDK
ncbi:MAG: hypothetical protein ACI4PV_03775 [Butyricicoccus sp.]